MKPKKDRNWDLVILACVCPVVLLFLCCGLVSCNLFSRDAGACLAISPFGRLELLGVDKAVVAVDGEAVTVTDPELLGRIVDETKVATHANVCDGCCMKERSIQLYRGDRLVRSMKWIDGHDSIRVYEADLTHWIFQEVGAGFRQTGYVELSDELIRELEGLF